MVALLIEMNLLCGGNLDINPSFMRGVEALKNKRTKGILFQIIVWPMCRFLAHLDGEVVNFGSLSFKMNAYEANGIANELIRLGFGEGDRGEHPLQQCRLEQ